MASKLNNQWRTSSRSGTNGQCVEARLHNGVIEVRNSKDRCGATTRFTTAEWKAFLASISEDGDFQLP